MSTAKKYAMCKEVVTREYTRKNSFPWVIAYSGGKDSTLLLQVVWEVMCHLPPKNIHRRVTVIGNDTLVESPLVIDHLRHSLSHIASSAKSLALPISIRITQPNIDQTFWVNVIGRGYIPPTRNFRWCTDRMKIIPTSRLLKDLVNQYDQTVLLIGTRKSESDQRRRNMEKRSVSGENMNPHDSIAGCMVFAPLAEFNDDDVWTVLMQRPPPWGGTHRNLITLYKNAGGGECPLVLSEKDAPSCGTTSPRFGCWTCTVVAKDRSMRGIIDSGHSDASILSKLFNFREWLIELREDDTNRQSVRRDGNTRTRVDGSRVMGPFTLQVRQTILCRLKELEAKTGYTLISEAEEELIEDIWRRDLVFKECRDALDQTQAFQGTGIE